MELKITQATLPQRSGLYDLAIDQGRIQAIAPTLPHAADSLLDAQKRLVIPGLVDAHIHLDKALLFDRAPAQSGTFGEAMRETLRLKQQFTLDDVQVRASRVLERAIAYGITLMRSHVEVDPTVGLTGMQALLPLRDRYAWGITLQLAVFDQEGLTRSPEALPLLRQAMQMGGDVIGSAPYIDPDPLGNIRAIFDLAAEFDCDVDFHLDFLDDEQPLLLPFVAEETIKRGWQGRVCVGHMTKLAGLPPDELQAIATLLKTAGISVLALPASDLYIMAQHDTHNVRRGVAPLHHLGDNGVNVGVATNNLRNLFTPFGDGDVLKICTLLAHVLQLGTLADQQRCLGMATVNAARAIGVKDYGLEVGQPADLVILDVESASEAIGAPPMNRVVIKQGRVVATTKAISNLFFPR